MLWYSAGTLDRSRQVLGSKVWRGRDVPLRQTWWLKLLQLKIVAVVNVWVMFVEPWETEDQRDAGWGQETKLDSLMMVTRNQLVDGAFWPENPLWPQLHHQTSIHNIAVSALLLTPVIEDARTQLFFSFFRCHFGCRHCLFVWRGHTTLSDVITLRF